MKNILKLHKADFIVSLCISVMSAICNVIGGVYLGKLLTAASLGDMTVLMETTLRTIGIWSLFFAVNTYRKNQNVKIMVKTNNVLRRHLANDQMCMDNSDWDKEDPADRVADYTTKIEMINDRCLTPLCDIFYEIFAVTGSLFALCRIHYSVGMISVILFLITMMIPAMFQKKLQVFSQKVEKSAETFMNRIHDCMYGRNEFLIYQPETAFDETVYDISKEYEFTKQKNMWYMNFSQTVINCSGLLSQMTLILLTAYLVIEKKSEIGSILAVGNLAGTFISGAGSVIGDVNSIIPNRYLIEQYHLNDVSCYVTDESLKITTINIHELKSVKIQEHQVKYHIKDLFFHKGKMYLIQGESGCGKSVLLRTVFMMHHPYDGSIQIDGMERSEIQDQKILSNTAYVDQTPHVFNDTLRYNLTLGKHTEDKKIMDILHVVGLSDLFQQKDLDAALSKNGKAVSGGEMERICLARALLSDKDVIVLDEPFSSLDHDISYQIVKYLSEQKDKLMIVTGHQIDSDIVSLFDEVITIA